MKLSVCITTYNHEQFIAQAIESVLCQDVASEFEIIIGEDQSSDRTRSIVLSYQREFPEKIKVFLHDYPANYERINGRKNAVNNLLHARGEYIALLDGDDYWTDSSKLQKQIDFLDQNLECSTVFHWVDWLENGSIKHKAYGPPYVKDFYDVNDLWTHSNFIPTCSVMFRRRFDHFPCWFFDCPFGDLPLHIMNSSYGSIGFIDESMGVYRVHSGGLFTCKSQMFKEINNLYAFELIANNLNSTHNPYYLSYVNARMSNILKLAKNEEAKEEGISLIDKMLLKPSDKALEILESTRMQLAYAPIQDIDKVGCGVLLAQIFSRTKLKVCNIASNVLKLSKGHKRK